MWFVLGVNAPPHTSPNVGLIGLAVMGQNLALNIARKGFPICVHNRSAAKVEQFLADRVEPADPVTGAMTIEELVSKLQRPRTVIVMVKAGSPVDALIEQLAPLLEDGDMIVDAGNSHPDETERRAREVTARGLRFVGMGVSGGEEGALLGPSIMPGGPRDAYDHLEPMLTAISAQVDDGPCVAWIGPGSAGHFVKMVHNGIEYGDMQLIAEAYDLLRGVLGLSAPELADTFRGWNGGVLESYLIEITGEIFSVTDPHSDAPLVEQILDRAGQKGTGRWTAEIALAHGVPLPTIHAAVDARGLSSRKDERRRASAVLSGPGAAAVNDRALIDDIHDALYASKICSYAQGMDLLRTASEAHGWDLDLAEIARIWKGGCIIRAKFLDRIQGAFRDQPSLENLLVDAQLGGWISEHQMGWRRVLGLAATHGVPVLAHSASLSYFDSYRRERLPQNLTQAQRDFFGAHTYERIDQPRGEFFHTDWGSA